MTADEIREEVATIETLGRAISWALSRTPPAEFLDVVAQDEYSLDVVVRVDPEIHVVFDTT